MKTSLSTAKQAATCILALTLAACTRTIATNNQAASATQQPIVSSSESKAIAPPLESRLNLNPPDEPNPPVIQTANCLKLSDEGHDTPRSASCPNPKLIDQPLANPSGIPTQNGRFFLAAQQAKANDRPPERVRVYEKFRAGIWTYTG